MDAEEAVAGVKTGVELEKDAIELIKQGKNAFEELASLFSSSDWEKKRRPMILLFANTSKTTPVKNF